VKIKDISVVAANATDAPSISVSCGSCIYEKKLRKEPMIYLSGDVKNGTRVAFKTTALDGGVRKTVRIEGELIFR